MDEGEETEEYVSDESPPAKKPKKMKGKGKGKGKEESLSSTAVDDLSQRREQYRWTYPDGTRVHFLLL